MAVEWTHIVHININNSTGQQELMLAVMNVQWVGTETGMTDTRFWPEQKDMITCMDIHTFMSISNIIHIKTLYLHDMVKRNAGGHDRMSRGTQYGTDHAHTVRMRSRCGFSTWRANR